VGGEDRIGGGEGGQGVGEGDGGGGVWGDRLGAMTDEKGEWCLGVDTLLCVMIEVDSMDI